MQRSGSVLKTIKSYLSYEPESGLLIWIKSPNKRIKIGKEAGCLRDDGHKMVRVDGTCYYAHVVAWFLHYGTWPDFEVDHKNRNGSDNRITNLRPSTRAQNASNRKIQSNNKSGLKGVHTTKTDGLYRARIGFNGKEIHLGYFKDKKEAHKVYFEAAKKLHGKFACKG